MNVDVNIVGAGIVGLSTAYQLIKLNPRLKIRILEKELHPAMHQTGHNSGVVHTGIYYKPESLKAQNCIAGRKELLAFCDTHGIAYKHLHKVIVATDPKELPKLKEIFSRGQANGVPDISLIGKEELQEIEPNVESVESILIPNCHIIDYKEVAQALCSWITDHGGEIIFNEEIKDITTESDRCTALGSNRSHQSKILINCGGLHSDRLARLTLGRKKVSQRILPFRGEYYELIPEKKDVINGLVYPVPDPAFPFLGVHLTKMMNGRVEAGPNAVLALAREGYRKRDVCLKDIGDILSYPGFWRMSFKYWRAGFYEMARSVSKQLFLKDQQRLVPTIKEADLIPGGAGVRAQVVTKEGGVLDDFSILQEKNSIHVINAPSPAATSSFSIGSKIAKMALQLSS